MNSDEKARTIATHPYSLLNPPARRLLLLDLLLAVPGSRELFEAGEAGDACRMVREAHHVKIGRGVGIDKETFLGQVLTGLAGDSTVNTYQSEETLV